MIEIRRTAEGDPLDFEVVVREGKGETRHHVTMSRETCEKLTAGTHTPERCLEAAFRFLLDREPKESILGRFDVEVISRYFPELSGSCRVISCGPDRSVPAFKRRARIGKGRRPWRGGRKGPSSWSKGRSYRECR